MCRGASLNDCIFKDNKMDCETLRLSSFVHFPINVATSAIQLSRAGFFYTGKGDEVECFSCKLKVKEWNKRGDPLLVHKQLSQNCTFLIQNWDNLGMGRLPNVNYLERRNGYRQVQTTVKEQSDENVAINHVETSIQDENTDTRSRNNYINSEQTNGRTTTSTLFPQPVHEVRPDYRYEKTRLESFRYWPSNAAVRPEDLAHSGFYYTGTDDRVQCTFCRGILRNWEPIDQPDAEHRRHFGQCPFLISPHGVGNIPIGRENVNKDGLIWTCALV